MPTIKAKLESAELTNHPVAIQRLLDACLTSDPAHITPHQKGEQVKIIQRALMTIAERSPDIGLKKINDKPGEYESDTIDAVLKYKGHFKIVRTGQRLDAIVGRMTISQIDDDLAKKKSEPEPDPATDPAEKGRVGLLLALHRPVVPVLIVGPWMRWPSARRLSNSRGGIRSTRSRVCARISWASTDSIATSTSAATTAT